MNRFYSTGLLVLFLSLSLGLVIVFRRDKEPSLEDHFHELSMQDHGKKWTHPSMKVLRKQWKRSVPMLIEVLAEKDSWQQKVHEWVYTNAPAIITAKLSQPLNPAQLTNRRETSAQVLAVIGPHAKPALPMLISTMNDRGTRNAAYTALQKIGPRNKDAKALLKLFREGQDPGIRGQAIACLVMTHPTPEVLRVLKSALEDEDSFVRGQAAAACGSLTNYSTGLVPMLMGRLGDPDSLVLVEVAGSIWKLTQNRTKLLA